METLPIINRTPMQLVARVVENPPGWRRGYVRWARVGDVFQLGSTSAIKLCELCNQNPHEIKGRKKP